MQTPSIAPGGVGLLGSAFTRYWLSPAALAAWTDEATVKAWLEVEAALAQAQAALGMIPSAAAQRIAAGAAKAGIDMGRLAAETAHAMHPFVPVLRQLEEALGEEAAGYLHWGATTQNIFDTGAALQMKRSHALLMADLDAAALAMAALAERHADTLQAGRTHGQHALPITFGFKVAGWLSELRRHRQRLKEAAETGFAAYMGGAVGAFAAMEGKGRAVQARVAKLLGLSDGDIPSRSSGDRQAAYVGLLAQFGGLVERIGRDVAFMQRTEIREVEEGFHHGKVGSSTMAQKRNPSWALNLVGMATLLRGRAHSMLDGMVRLDEGDASQSNVSDATLPEAMVLGLSLAAGLDRLIRGLHVDEAAMARNVEASRGLIMTEAVMMRLGRAIGRHRAHDLLYEAAMEAFEKGEALKDALGRRPDVAALGLDLDALLDPRSYVGEAPDCARAAAASVLSPKRQAAE